MDFSLENVCLLSLSCDGNFLNCFRTNKSLVLIVEMKMYREKIHVFRIRIKFSYRVCEWDNFP